MNRFLTSFSLPTDIEEALIKQQMIKNGGLKFGYIDNAYPCCIFDEKQLYTLDFAPITILYGGNGSGKSTILNLIAEKLSLRRCAPFNSGELFASYAENCTFTLGSDDLGEPLTIPEGSAIITSDDVFDYMLAVRSNNLDIAEEKTRGREEHKRLKYGETIKLSGMDDYEELRLQVLARSRSVSRRKFLRKTAGEEVRLRSNGETALEFFESRLSSDLLYCLDEPENSMSAPMQAQLARILEEAARFFGCQLIIATHSPFLLAMEGARIYDLDSAPVKTADWWELKNMRCWYEFFKKHEKRFE